MSASVFVKIHKVSAVTLVFLLILLILAMSCEPDPGPYTGVELPELLAGTASVSILLLGDAGTGTSSQQAVSDSIVSYYSGNPIDFALLLGDNFYSHGVSSIADPQWNSKFVNMYPAASLPFDFYVILGNHDYEGNPSAQYAYSEPGADRWKCIDLGTVLPIRLSDNSLIEIFLLDSEMLNDGIRGKRLAEWAKNRMRSSAADYRILAAHRPLYSSGYHGDTQYMINYFEEEFRAGCLDMAIAGHDHILELQDRNLEPDAEAELFIVCGTGAMTRSYDAGPDSVFVRDSLGFGILTLSAAGPEVGFYGLSAAELFSWP